MCKIICKIIQMARVTMQALHRWQHVCIVSTYSKSTDQPGMVVNPARGQP